VNPGFGAQKFIPGALAQSQDIVEVANRSGCLSGLKSMAACRLITVGEIVRAERSCLLRATAVFSKADIRENAKKLLEAARAATLTRPEQQTGKRF